MEPMKIVTTIVEQGDGNDIADLYEENQVSAHFHCTGRGTASSELLDVFGFGTSERDILFSLGAGSDVDRLIRQLGDALRSRVDTKGIAFSMRLNAINNLLAVALLQQESPQQATDKGEYGMEQSKGGYSLILVAVDQGCTDDVMNTAREAGARGGTVMRARWTGGKYVEQFYGITLQGEKEIIAIVAADEKRDTILQAINKEHGLRSEAHGMICSVPLDQVVRLG